VSDDRPGVLYAVENKVWPGWLKVGRAEGRKSDADATVKRRLYQYNTGDPLRGYSVVAQGHAACCRAAERYAHAFLEVHYSRGGGEWFRCSAQQAEVVVSKACHVARLAPHARAARFKQFIEEMRSSVKKNDTREILVEALEGSERLPLQVDVSNTARAASAVIKDLLECMAMGDERLEAAADAVLRKLDSLGEA
jgi:T5orf172 domain-containing protein